MRIVFARTRYTYDSYTDYWKLVELEGFDTCFVDEIRLDADDTIFIVSPINGEVRPHLQNERTRVGTPSAKTIWWNLERPMGNPDTIGDLTGYVNAAWVSDRAYADMDKRFTFVVLGGHAGLCEASAVDAVYDYAHMSYIHGRRQGFFELLQSHRLQEAPNCWGDKRARVLACSKMMVNVHQTDEMIGEPLRFVLAAAYKLPLVTETLHNCYPLAQNGVDHLQAPLGSQLLEAIVSLKTDPERGRQLGQELYDLYCVRKTFRACVEEGVANTNWNWWQ